MDEDLLELIDKQVNQHTYWNRSRIICNILSAVLTKFTEKEIYDMIRFWYYQNNVVITKFEITDELTPLKPRNNG